MRVDDLYIDDVNEAKMSARGVAVSEAYEVIDGSYSLVQNLSKTPGVAPWVIIGPTRDARRFLTIPVDPAREDGAFRPRTAFDSTAGQVDVWRRQHQR